MHLLCCAAAPRSFFYMMAHAVHFVHVVFEALSHVRLLTNTVNAQQLDDAPHRQHQSESDDAVLERFGRLRVFFSFLARFFASRPA